MTDLSHLAPPGATIAVHVTPNARRAGVDLADGRVRVAVTETPEAGTATEAARTALTRAMGVAKMRLVLVRGATAGDKVFRPDGG